MTPEEARAIWYSEVKDVDEESLMRAIEAGETLGYVKREWDPIVSDYVSSLTKLGVIAFEKFERERRQARRGFCKEERGT